MEQLLAGIDLGAINTSMTINATAPFMLALYLVVAEKRGVPWTELRGTTQNDMLKEFVARGTSIFHPEVSFRISTEIISFAVERMPNWNPINCCGYHYMESGAGPAEEIGYAFGNALMILDALRPRLVPEAFEQTVRRISFFINSGIELVPEISKVRAYFKLWRELCRDEYGIDGRRVSRRMPGAFADAHRAPARSQHHPHRLRGVAGGDLGRRPRQRLAASGFSRGDGAAGPGRAGARACARSKS